jgi:branched-chain amino acid transport system substrate-binding protein
MNNEIGKSMVKSLSQNLDNLACGVNIVSEEYFDPANADFKPLLGKLPKSENPDFYIAGLSANLANFLKQKSEMGTSGQVYGFRTVEDPSFLPATGALAEGLVYTYAFDPLGSGAGVREFVNAYKSLYGEDPDGFAAEGFEGLMVTVNALQQCGRNDACLQSVFQSWGKVDSVFGPMSFDENGDVAYPFFLKTVKNGKFARLEEAH